MTKRVYSIGAFAQKACVSLRTLRYYDAVGLLSPARHTEAGYRLYKEPIPAGKKDRRLPA